MLVLQFNCSRTKGLTRWRSMKYLTFSRCMKCFNINQLQWLCFALLYLLTWLSLPQNWALCCLVYTLMMTAESMLSKRQVLWITVVLFLLLKLFSYLLIIHQLLCSCYISTETNHTAVLLLCSRWWYKLKAQKYNPIIFETLNFFVTFQFILKPFSMLFQ